MPIDTTLYVHESTLDSICEICALTGRTRNRIIVMLLRAALRDRSRAVRIGCSVRYQSRDRREKWRTVHVRLSEDEADYFKDLRNFYRMSDSLILAIAVRDYFDDILRQSISGGMTDNYPFSNYILSREEIDGLVFWRICWGFPEKPEKYFLLRPIQSP